MLSCTGGTTAPETHAHDASHLLDAHLGANHCARYTAEQQTMQYSSRSRPPFENPFLGLVRAPSRLRL